MMRKIKALVPRYLKQQLNAYVGMRVAYAMEQGNTLASFRTPYWYEWNPCEPNVQVALNDLARPGDTVFDVGANAGSLTLALSRAVGPRGIVCAFEASPRIIDKCQYNLVQNGVNNVTLYHNAVYSKSRQILKIYPGDHLNDSVIARGEHPEQAAEIETITLDDFSARYGLVPTLIKIDIELAEYDALLGAERLIAEHHPHLIMEQQMDDARCLNHLLQRGYHAIDLCNFRTIRSMEDFEPGVGIANILFIHSSRIAGTGYEPSIRMERVAELQSGDFSKSGNDTFSKPIVLEPGRYYFDNEFEAEGRDNDAYFGLEANGRTIFRYHTHSQLHASNYRDWVVDLKTPSTLTIFSCFRNGTSDPTLQWKKSTVYRIPALSRS